MGHLWAFSGILILVACGTSDGGSPAAGGAGGDAGAVDSAGSSNAGAGADAGSGATSTEAGFAGSVEADAGSGAGGSGGSFAGGGAESAGTGGNAAGNAGTAGSAPLTMDCHLVVSAVSATCNLTLTEFAAQAGQGATTHKAGHTQQQGLHAQLSTQDSTEQLDIAVSGDAPTAGASYNVNGLDAPGAAAVTFSVRGAQLFAWDASLGGVVTVATVTPGAVPSYSNVTFGLDKVEFSPRSAATDNKAVGTFKLSGNCAGAITN